jgi:hypothetical protein
MLVRMMASESVSRRTLLTGLASLLLGAAGRADTIPTSRTATYLRRYRVRATVTVFSVPLFSKDNVGGACAMVEEAISGSSRASAIQFSSGSWPEHLKGFNRFGMAQEAVREESGHIAESVYVSFMTSSAEKNLEQAKHSFAERTAEQPIVVAQGRARRSGYASALDHLTVSSRSTWADCPRLLVELKERLSPMKEAVAAVDAESAYQPFLHAVRAAMASGSPSTASVFAHNAKLYRLVTRTSAVPEGALLVGKISEHGGAQESEFRVWFDPQDVSGLPLRFEFRPKSFLHLVFEQDQKVTAPEFFSLLPQEQL